MTEATEQIKNKDIHKELTKEMEKSHKLETDLLVQKAEIVRLHHELARWVIGEYEI